MFSSPWEYLTLRENLINNQKWLFRKQNKRKLAVLQSTRLDSQHSYLTKYHLERIQSKLVAGEIVLKNWDDNI